MSGHLCTPPKPSTPAPSAALRGSPEAQKKTLLKADPVQNATQYRARKQAKEEIDRAVVESANLAKSDFLSSMSHELRSPLNAILGFAQLMEADSPTPAQSESISQILNAGWYLLDLINEMLDLAALESGKLSLSLEPVSLDELLVECRSIIEPLAQRRRILLNFPPGEGSHGVRADRTRIKQILINLLSNAIKFNAAEGSVTIDCAESATPGRIRIRVADTGAGLPPKKVAQLFQPFKRLGEEGEVGTGIGRVVCKRLVELMDGVIGVDSIVGTGSVFWVELPSTNAAASSKETHALPG